MTTFSASLTNIRSSYLGHMTRLLRKHKHTGTSTADCRNTPIYAHTNSRTLLPGNISFGSLTLPAFKVGYFLELILLCRKNGYLKEHELVALHSIYFTQWFKKWLLVRSPKSYACLIIPAVKKDFTGHRGLFCHCTRLPLSVSITQKQRRIKGRGQKIRSKVPILQVKRLTGFYCEFQRSLREQQMSHVVSLNYTQRTETS
jgi:hypothetical protein